MLRPRLEAEPTLLAVYEHFEKPLIRVLARMERRGIATDTAALATLSGDLAAHAALLLADVRELAGEPSLNVGSRKQLRARSCTTSSTCPAPR